MVITRANAQTTMSFMPMDRVFNLACKLDNDIGASFISFLSVQNNFAMQSKCAKKGIRPLVASAPVSRWTSILLSFLLLHP